MDKINLILIFLVLKIGCLAQNPVLKFERLSIKDGLSQILVNCVLQGKEGIIEIRTKDSQNKFDYKTNSRSKYLLKNRTSNSEVSLNFKRTSMYLEITPSFCFSLWFKILLLVIIVILIFVYIKYRESQFLKRRIHSELSERANILQKEAEKLKESEDKFRMMFQNHNAVMLLIDPSTNKIVDANISACKFYKYTHQQLCAMNVEDIFIFETELEYNLLKKTITDNQNKAIYKHKLGDGGIRMVEVDSSPFETKKDHFFFSIVYDVTEKKKAEDALIESYEFNESLLQTIPFGMQIVDEQGQIMFLNSILRDELGIDSVGKNCWEVFCDSKNRCENCPLASNFKFGVTTISETRGLMNGRVFQIYHTGMMYDKKRAILEIFHDITAIKNAEKVAEENSTRLTLATIAGGIGVWDFDIANDKLLWDDQMYSIYGIKESEFSGTHSVWEELIIPDDFKAFEKEINESIANKKEFNIEYRINSNGEIKNVRAIAIVQYDSSANPIRIIGTNWDITKQKKLESELIKSKERAESASVAKSDFLATMSHEIRTPLNGVIGFSDILMKTKLSETQFEYMKNIHVSANSLLDLVNDILDFSKIEAGKLELNPEPIDIIEFAGNIVEIMKFKVLEKGIELLLNISPGIPRIIIADPIRLRQVLINLLGNATKFTDSGEIELKITSTRIENNEKEMEFLFSVRDTGIGIPKEKQETIFQSFSQADSSTTRKYGGTGLGLSISNNLVKKMGSVINVESHEWLGSTFHFTLKLPFEINEAATKYDIDWVKKVLVIDDNATNRNIIDAMLDSHNIKVEKAENGILALEMIEKNNNYDFIILDYNMPYMDGLQVVRNIKMNEKIKNQIILFLHSSGENETVLSKCKEYGVKYILQKPLRLTQLYNTITHIKTNYNKNSEIVEQKNIDFSSISNQKIKVLIVDDNQMNINLASSLVKINLPNAEVYETRMGTEACRLYLKHNPDLVLMDIQMPLMNGYEASKEIRDAENKLNRRVPIIALTAGTVAGEKERCLAAGMDEYVPKPLNSKILSQVFERFLKEDSSVEIIRQETIPKSILLHFDKQELLDRYENDEEFVSSFIKTCFETMPQYINDLDNAIKLSDVAQIKFNAHSIKGMARGISFQILAEYAYDIEKKCQDNIEECKEAFNLLKAEIEFLTKEYSKNQ